MTNPTLPTAGVAELLAGVEAAQNRMQDARRKATSPWNEGYTQGAADAYGVVADQIRKLVEANISGAA